MRKYCFCESLHAQKLPLIKYNIIRYICFLKRMPNCCTHTEYRWRWCRHSTWNFILLAVHRIHIAKGKNQPPGWMDVDGWRYYFHFNSLLIHSIFFSCSLNLWKIVLNCCVSEILKSKIVFCLSLYVRAGPGRCAVCGCHRFGGLLRSSHKHK